MAINKAVKAAIRAISNMEPDDKDAYKTQRRLAELKKFYIRPLSAKSQDLVISDGRLEVPVRLYTFPDAVDETLIFIHGGGWTTEDIDTYNMVCFTLAHQTNRRVLSIDYRLAPEHRFPAAVEDCFMVIRKAQNGEIEGIAAGEITLIGDSAGGNLSAAVSLKLRDEGFPLPIQQILIYPATTGDHMDTERFPSLEENGTDFILTTKRICDYMDLYQSSVQDQENPYFAPLTSQSFTNQPPTLLITAQFDPLRDEGEAYGNALVKAGNEVYAFRMLDAIHGFFALPSRFAHVKAAYEIINSFLDHKLAEYIPSKYVTPLIPECTNQERDKVEVHEKICEENHEAREELE